MTNKEYNQIINRARTKELRLTREALERNIFLLQGIADRIELSLSQFADDDGNLRKEQLTQIKARVEGDLDTFRDAHEQLVLNGSRDMVEVILDRNGQILLEVEGTRKLIDTLHDDIMDSVLKKRGKDGLILSDRVWRITEETKIDIADRLQKGIIEGTSHIKIARDLRKNAIGQNLKYKTELLAFTEMAKAYKDANERAVEEMRKNSQYMWYEKLELSERHPSPDACDILASQDLYGEGPGIYKQAPNRHPGCFCLIYPVYRPKREKGDYPQVSDVPVRPEGLPKHQKKLAKELTR